MTLRAYILRYVSFLAQILIYFMFVTGLHEQGHALMGKLLGVPGYVIFHGLEATWEPFDRALASSWEWALIGLAGGGLVALAFGVLWLIQHFQGQASNSEIDTAAIFAIITIFQIAYAFSEALEKRWEDWIQLIGVIVAVVVMVLLYGRRLLSLLLGEKAK